MNISSMSHGKFTAAKTMTTFSRLLSSLRMLPANPSIWMSTVWIWINAKLSVRNHCPPRWEHKASILLMKIALRAWNLAILNNTLLWWMFGCEGRRRHIEEPDSAFACDSFGQHWLSSSGGPTITIPFNGRWMTRKKSGMGRGRTTVSWRHPIRQCHSNERQDLWRAFRSFYSFRSRCCRSCFDRSNHWEMPVRIIQPARLVIVIIDFKTLDNQTRTANSLVWPAKVFESVMLLA